MRGSSPACRFAHAGYEDRDKFLHSRGTKCPSFVKRWPSQTEEGAGNAGCWPHPRGLACKRKCTLRTQATQGSRNNRHSPRNGVTAYTRSPRSAGLVSLRRLADRPRNLISASGDQDHATSPSAPPRSSLAAQAAIASPPHASVTIGGNVPLHRGGMRETLVVICPTRQAKRSAAEWHDGQTEFARLTTTRVQVGSHVRQLLRAPTQVAREHSCRPASRRSPRNEVGIWRRPLLDRTSDRAPH
jgi:hypothetical protein